MSTNVFNITADNANGVYLLHGDMSVSFNEKVDSGFSIKFFTTTYETFTFDSLLAKFVNVSGQVVSSMSFGGRPGLFIELMFDELANSGDGIWYITSSNVVSAQQ